MDNEVDQSINLTAPFIGRAYHAGVCFQALRHVTVTGDGSHRAGSQFFIC